MSSSPKHRLFKIFSSDLKKTFARYHLKFSSALEGIPDELYLCPISLNYFVVDAIEQGDLTLEHVPPNSLGGKGKILTCKLINNNDGKSSDKKLLDYFRSRLFERNKGKIDAKISSNELNFRGIGATMSLKIDGKPSIQFVTSKKNISALEYNKLFESWNGTSFNVTWQLQQKIDKSALLKCAYLTAFNYVGYPLLMDAKGFKDNTYGLLAAFLRQEKPAADFPVPFLNEHSPEGTPDVGLINHPMEYRALYVNLTFALDGHQFKYAVFLPHPLDQNLDALNNLSGLFLDGNGGKKVELKITLIPENFIL